VSDQGLFAFDPSSGALLWHYPTPGVPRATQPRTISPTDILFDTGPDSGTALIRLSKADGSWVPTDRWVSRQLKPSFNDFVVCENALYGFDGRMLTCVDLETGRRRWKEGRYGSGQALLLRDQPILLLVTDEGEVVLVAADPNEHQELTRFQAVEGKTWNHPVIAHGRLYVRNSKEFACYELRTEQAVRSKYTAQLQRRAGTRLALLRPFKLSQLTTADHRPMLWVFPEVSGQDRERDSGCIQRSDMAPCDAASVNEAIASSLMAPPRMMPNGCPGSPTLVLLRSCHRLPDGCRTDAWFWSPFFGARFVPNFLTAWTFRLSSH
jgi:hypothetical protein